MKRKMKYSFSSFSYVELQSLFFRYTFIFLSNGASKQLGLKSVKHSATES